MVDGADTRAVPQDESWHVVNVRAAALDAGHAASSRHHAEIRDA